MEFGMQQSASFNSQPMEWYSAGPAGAGQYASAAYQYAPPPSMPAASAYSNTFEDEPPLLEELGIDIPSILQRTKVILLHQMKDSCLDELDFGGALIFLLLLGGLHLLLGKMHFGVLLGWSVLQSIVLWFVVNQIASNEAAEHRALDLYSCCCIVGYGMLPLILLSFAVLLMPRGPAERRAGHPGGGVVGHHGRQGALAHLPRAGRGTQPRGRPLLPPVWVLCPPHSLLRPQRGGGGGGGLRLRRGGAAARGTGERAESPGQPKRPRGRAWPGPGPRRRRCDATNGDG